LISIGLNTAHQLSAKNIRCKVWR